MKATDILMSEHRVIEGVLASLETATEQLAEGAPIRPGFFIEAADFFKGFADGCHHLKEEGALFPAMISSGLPSRNGPVAVMLNEHQQGREYIAAMRQAAQKIAEGDENARVQVIQAARGYVALLRGHISKEDTVLFPLAGKLIPADQQEQVVEEFEQVEHEETGPGVHEKYLALAKALRQEVATEYTR